jgi:hypothetical protein
MVFSCQSAAEIGFHFHLIGDRDRARKAWLNDFPEPAFIDTRNSVVIRCLEAVRHRGREIRDRFSSTGF